MKQAIALCRVSTHRQSAENHSLEKQWANVQKAAERLEVPIVNHWKLATSSKAGVNLNRKDLREALAYCSKHKSVKYCIIDEVDRLMRSIKEYYWFKVEFERRGVRLVFASDPDLSEETQEAKFREMLKIYGAESDNTMRKAKVTSHMQATMARGLFPFPVKAGYKKSDTPGLHIPDSPRFELLQHAIRLVISRTHTPHEALKWLTQNGYRTVNGKSLDMYRWMRVLREPFYCGMVSIKNWPVHKGSHQAMITPDEFEELQYIIQGRKPKYKKTHHNPAFPGQKVFSCGECGAGGKITGSKSSNGHGGTFERYYCRACRQYNSKQKVHAALDNLIAHVSIPKAHAAKLTKALIQVWDKKNVERSVTVRSMQQVIDKLSEQKASLVVAYATAPEAIQPDLATQIQNIKTDIQWRTEQMVELQQGDKELRRFIAFAFDYLSNMSAKWWNLDREEMQWCQKIFFPGEIMVYAGGKVGTTEISPIFRLLGKEKDLGKVSLTYMVELAGIAPASVGALVGVLQA